MTPVFRNFAAAAATAAVAMLTSCGGGGGSGSAADLQDGRADASIAFSVPSLNVSAFQFQQKDLNAFEDATVSVDVAVTTSQRVTGVTYMVVQDQGSGFVHSAIAVTETDAGFRASLRPNLGLPPGSYSGNLLLHLCKDLGCAQEYAVSGGSLPYQVSILPQLQGSVFVNGVPAGTVQSSRVSLPLSIADGTVVEVRTNVPVTMMYSTGPGFVTATVDPASTTTAWKAILARPAFPSTNTIEIEAVPTDATHTIQMGAGVTFTMVP